MASPSATFLMCVESGYIEGQLPIAVEAIRRFGGRLADAPVLVVTPRFGPSLTAATERKLAEQRLKRQLECLPVRMEHELPQH